MASAVDKPQLALIVLRTLAVMALLLTAASPAIAPAQARPRSAASPCFRARPAPDCRVFLLTNAGGYLTSRGSASTSPWRVVIDWGVMVNVSRRAAIGGSWFVGLDDDEELTTGPMVRYRRWFDHARSLDLAVGTPVTGGQNLEGGSIFALVKYNPVRWFGVAVRPEYLRHTVHAPVGFADYTESSGRISAGVEVGEVPGVVLSVSAAVAVSLLVILFAVSGGFD